MLGSRGLLTEADAVVTCNPTEAALLQEKFPGKKIHVQPHDGIVDGNYKTDQRAAALKVFPQLAEKQILLCVGRVDPVKNQAWVVEQLPAILQRHPCAMLVLARGMHETKSMANSLRRKIAGTGLENHVLLTGGLPPGDPRLIGLMQLAAVVVLPSLSETFGLVLLEAWAAGASVISSRTSGAKALIKEDENGRLFDLEQPETFHLAVQQTLANPELSKQFAAQGGELVTANYDTAALAGRMKNLYEKLIEEKNALRNPA